MSMIIKEEKCTEKRRKTKLDKVRITEMVTESFVKFLKPIILLNSILRRTRKKKGKEKKA